MEFSRLLFGTAKRQAFNLPVLPSLTLTQNAGISCISCSRSLSANTPTLFQTSSIASKEVPKLLFTKQFLGHRAFYTTPGSKDENKIPESPSKSSHPLFHDDTLPHFRRSLQSKESSDKTKPQKNDDSGSSKLAQTDLVHPDIEEAKGIHEGGYRLPHPIWNSDELESVMITHKPPQNLIDKMAYHSVKTIRTGFDIISGYKLAKYRGTLDEKQWVKRIIFLETVAGVPGMVGAMVRHLVSLRKMQRDHGWIHTLLEEAENERMHLMTALRIANPGILMRVFIAGAQGVFVSMFSLAYFISPRFCHRFVGYLEEEAVVTYTDCLKAIDSGDLKMWSRMKAPEIAIEYWKLPEDAMMRDVILAIRADEAHHRAVNHTLGSKKPDDTNPYRPGE